MLFNSSEYERNNHDLGASAKERIRQLPNHAFHRVWCECVGSQLVLKGQVPSVDHKEHAHEAMQGIQGVDQVVNEIEVVW